MDKNACISLAPTTYGTIQSYPGTKLKPSLHYKKATQDEHWFNLDSFCSVDRALRRYWGGESLPSLENLPFHRGKMVIQCISAGQPTGPRTVGQMVLLEKVQRQTSFCRAFLTSPSNLLKLGLWPLHHINHDYARASPSTYCKISASTH